MTLTYPWMTLKIFTVTLTLGQEPYKNIERLKSTFRSFLKMLEDFTWKMLNFDFTFLEMLKL